MLDQEVGHKDPQVGGDELPFLFHHVQSVLQSGDDRGVGAGPSDSLGFQLLDQASFGVAGRSLGKVLLGLELEQLQLLSGFSPGQYLIVFFLAGVKG